MVREIIDIDTNYMEEENSSQTLKNKKIKMKFKQIKIIRQVKKDTTNPDDEDEFNPTLTAMESELNQRF